MLVAFSALCSCAIPIGQTGPGAGSDGGGAAFWGDVAGAGAPRGQQATGDVAIAPDSAGNRSADGAATSTADTAPPDVATAAAPDIATAAAPDTVAVSAPDAAGPDSSPTDSQIGGQSDSSSSPIDSGASSIDSGASSIDSGAWSVDSGASSMDSGVDPPDTGGSVADPALPGAQTWTKKQVALAVPGAQIQNTVFAPSGSGKRPLVIFLHGFSLTPNLYASYGEHLASHGWTVLLPKLPGNVLMPTSHAKLAKMVMALLDQLLSAKAPVGAIDTSRIALVGHSMGGKVAMLAAAKDGRIKAVFGVDPVDAAPPFGANPVDYPSVTPELMGDIQVAMGALGETVNAKPGLGGQACAPAAENFQQYFKHASGPALEVEVIGAGHMAFLDQPNCGLMCMACSAGPTPAATARKLARRYLTAFLGHTLLGGSGWASWLNGAKAQSDVQAGLITLSTKNGL